MSVCLCLDSAEKLLDAMALGLMRRGERVEAFHLKECVTTKKEVKRALSLLPRMEEPLQLLVADQDARGNRQGIKGHVWSGYLPNGALIQVAEGVFVAAPEFNALLAMGKSTWLHRPQVLMSSCGIFAIDDSSEDGFVRRPPVTNIKRLSEFAVSMPKCHRTRAMLDALALTAERARSPMEAKLVLPLIVPRDKGGFGFEKPELNAPIRLSSEGQAIWGKDVVDGDLLWRLIKKLLEYNGRLRHEGKLGKDLTRAAALEASGYDVRIVTYEQMKSARQMLQVGRWLAEGMGIPADNLPERKALQPILTDVLAYEHPRFALPKPEEVPAVVGVAPEGGVWAKAS